MIKKQFCSYLKKQRDVSRLAKIIKHSKNKRKIVRDYCMCYRAKGLTVDEYWKFFQWAEEIGATEEERAMFETREEAEEDRWVMKTRSIRRWACFC